MVKSVKIFCIETCKNPCIDSPQVLAVTEQIHPCRGAQSLQQQQQKKSKVKNEFLVENFSSKPQIVLSSPSGAPSQTTKSAFPPSKCLITYIKIYMTSI